MKRTVLFLALMLAVVLSAPAQTVYTPDIGNLVSDPSATPWDYGVGTQLGAAPATPATRSAIGDFLYMQETSTYNGVVGINFGSTPTGYFGYTVEPGAMFVHTHQNTSRIVKVRFTVPQTGEYTISALWKALNGTTTPIRSFVSVRTATSVPTVTTTLPVASGAKVIYRGNRLIGTPTPTSAPNYSFNATLDLQQGDEIYFEVNAGNDWFSDGTQADISVTANTPPPPSCDNTDLPFWDGTISPQGGGVAYIPVEAGAGLNSVVLGSPSTNLALREVRSADGTTVLTDFAGSDPIAGDGAGAGCDDGFGTLTFTGTPGGEPTDVMLVVCAPQENQGSSFYLEVTDACPSPRTLRVDPVLELFGASTDVEAAGVPTEYALEGNYPNPFNPTTEISFALPEASAVQLQVFDLLGRTVATLVNGEAMTAGQHSVQFEAGDLPSGTYLYRLTAGSFQQTRRMTLLK